MINTERLRQAIKDFEYWSSPNSSRSSAPATAGDINKLIKATSDVLRAFVDELEQSK